MQLKPVLDRLRYRMLSLLGYDQTVLAAMASRDVRWLAISGAWCLVSALVFAAAGSYLAYLGVYSDRFLAPVAVIAFGAIFLFALNMQRMFVTSGGFGYHWEAGLLSQWRPDPLRVSIVIFLAVLFSQPWLLLIDHSSLEEKMADRVAVVTAVYQGAQAAEQTHRRDALLQRRAQMEEQLSFLGLPVAERAGETSQRTAPTKAPLMNRRKALVIGMEKYRNAPVLPNVSAAAQRVKGELERIGFQVTTVTDPSYDDALMSLDSYIKTVRPGDVSLVYFAGYAFSNAGIDYFAPVDFAPGNPDSSFNLRQMLEDLAARSPQLSVAVLDVSRPPSVYLHPLAPLTPPRTSYVVAASQAPTVAGNPAWNGALTAAALRHIGSADDINAVFGQVKADLSATAHRSPGASVDPQIWSSVGQGYHQIAPGAFNASGSAAHLLISCGGAEFERDAAAGACVLAAMHALDSELDELDGVAAARLKNRADAYQRALARSGMVRERWMLLWASPWSGLVLTMVGILVMSGGDLLRDRFPSSLRAYERERASLARKLIEKRYADVKIRIGERLAHFPPPILPGRRWHELDKYFDASAFAVPLRHANVEPHGSVDDLLDRLDWAEPPSEPST